MGVYFALSNEPKVKRAKYMIAGGLISLILAYPTWAGIGHHFSSTGSIEVYWLSPITFIYAVSGQFLPEMLQAMFPKLAKKLFKDKTGEDLEK